MQRWCIFAMWIGLCATVGCAADRSGRSSTTPAPDPQRMVKPSVVHVEEASAANPKNGSFAEIRHLARGNNAYLGYLLLGPGMQVPLHRDATEEYLFILSGSGTLYIDGTPFEVRTGHGVLMPANAEVRFENGAEELRAVQVFAGPSPAKKYETWEPKIP